MAKKSNTLSNFAIESAFGLSSGRMFNHHSGEPIKVQLKGLLGTQSQFTKDEKKIEQSMNKPNPQKVEIAMLDQNEDTLRVTFTWKIIRDIERMNITMSSVPEMYTILRQLHEAYKEQNGYQVLAERYAAQIVKGEPLFRNRYGLGIGITVKSSLGREYHFDNRQPGNDFEAFVEDVKRGLEGEIVVFDIDMTSKIGKGQQVFPSQEMEMNSGKNAVSRVLDKDLQGNAMMHPWKLGNAIRTIDTWYPEYDQHGFAIAVEPYGANIRRFTAFRTGSASYYSRQKEVLQYLDSGKKQGVVEILDGKPIDEIRDIHYFMAMLCRGGVLGTEGKNQ